ncbi:hypothetical protein BRETT_000218 [Brettanomyces bruxellensis]|uniref:Pantothenate transporter n=1 Tax=Dekkera bruxellensis TaxID=5007 RepID=A0A871R8Q2_DEKBR|nr:uncharacterized protein BRETT_000218 [Brettanomyces bruxellensis]QOU18490.1 hypothetical protein BRETT_000218 [Brettanomyces bruxellensis]
MFSDKIRHAIWGVTPDPKERKLLQKIDWFVLSFVCLNYWVNYLDRSNYSNAYVSGMKEDLNLQGYQFNKVNTCFTVGYTIGMIPNNIALLKFKPRYWMSFCSFAWGLLTLGMYKVTDFKQLCVIRFFQALFESSTFSGTHYILGNWYKDYELTKRSAVFTSSGLVGSIFSGFMQTAIHKNMDGKNGLAGWRWLFIIDFIITIPICIYGFICFPDVPKNCNKLIFNEEERQLAIDRLPKKPETKLDLSVFKRVIGCWHWWLFSLLWAFGGENESYVINSLFALWLKAENYTIAQRNDYPLGIYAVGIFSTFFTSLYVDLTGARYHWYVAIWIAFILLISSILLLCKPLSKNFVFAAHYLSGVCFSGQSTFFAWVNVLCYDDLEERAIILASMNMFSNAVNAWWPLIFYKASSAPKFRIGCYAMLGTLFASLFVAAAIRFLQLKDQKKKSMIQNISSSSDQESVPEKNGQIDYTIPEVEHQSNKEKDETVIRMESLEKRKS